MSDPFEDTLWIIIVGFIFSFVLAFGIGANNAANFCGVVCGTKSMRFRQICFIIFISRLVGTFIMSYQLSDLNPNFGMTGTCSDFNVTKGELMEKSTVIIAASSVWLMLCTILGLPVSASYSIIGAELGSRVTSVGLSKLDWTHFITKYLIYGTMGVIFTTFVCTAIGYYMFYTSMGLLNTAVSEKKWFKRQIAFLLEICVLVVMFVFIIYTPSFLIYFHKEPIYSIIPPVIRVLVGLFMVYLWKRSRGPLMSEGSFTDYIIQTLRRMFFIKEVNVCNCKCHVNSNDFKTLETKIEIEEPGAAGTSQDRSLNCCVGNFYISCNKYILNRSLFTQTSCNTSDQSTQENPDPQVTVCETSGPTEELPNYEALRARWFSRLTQTIVILNCIAYGGHDVSNSVGTIFVILKVANISRLLDICDERITLLTLLLGVCFISLGVWFFGKTVIKAVADLVPLQPIGGFCAEISTVFAIFVCSHMFELPVSITYCKITAMVAVGVVDRSLNWCLFTTILFCWLMTILVCALLSSMAYYLLF